MHLLNVDTLRIETFHDANDAPAYAILSHTWSEEEVTFIDIQDPHSPRTTSLAGFEKIRRTCDQARTDGYQYVWVDACCIDRSSSAELSEAINSMFQWYSAADVCYAYLSDVTKAEFEETFPQSRWFTRGWTLQELLAPDHVRFYDRDWHDLGTKSKHAHLISQITGIDLEPLLPSQISKHTSLSQFCIAKRMSWASKRETTRVEDMAYCLLGIFNINMPLIYGERERAFVRLQEELIMKNDDDSILAWGFDIGSMHPFGEVPSQIRHSIAAIPPRTTSLLASSPREFRDCYDLRYDLDSSTSSFMIRSDGLHMELPLVLVSPKQSYHADQAPHIVPRWLGLLSCSRGKGSEFLGIMLWPRYGDSSSLKVRRVTFGDPGHTVRVGPRVAMQAEQKAVTIFHEAGYRIARDCAFGFRNFMIDESRALLDAGYEVSHATARNIKNHTWPFDYRGNWDSTGKVLTVASRFRNNELIWFEFTAPAPAHGFTVLVRGNKATIRNGVSLPEAETEDSYRYLGDINATRGMILQGCHGTKNLVSVTMREKTVHFSRLIEVHVDLTPY